MRTRSKRFSNGLQHSPFASGRHPAPITQVCIAFFKVFLSWDVASRTIAITGHADERVWSHPLRRELVLDVAFAGQQQNLRELEIENGHLNGSPGLNPFAPAQSHGREALLERFSFGSQLAFKGIDREAVAVSRLQN